MVLAIAGNYDWDAFLELVNQFFDVFPNQLGEEEKGRMPVREMG